VLLGREGRSLPVSRISSSGRFMVSLVYLLRVSIGRGRSSSGHARPLRSDSDLSGSALFASFRRPTCCFRLSHTG
jgi:hypothetical protein